MTTNFTATVSEVANIINKSLSLRFKVIDREVNTMHPERQFYQLQAGDYKIDLSFNGYANEGKCSISGTYLDTVYHNEVRGSARVAHDRGASAIASAILNRFWDDYAALIVIQRGRLDSQSRYRCRKEKAMMELWACGPSRAVVEREAKTQMVTEINLPYNDGLDGKVTIGEVYNSEDEWKADIKLSAIPMPVAKKIMALLKGAKV